MIHAVDLGKRYRIGALWPGQTSFRETAMRALAAPYWRLARLGQPPPPAETVWALRHCSFEVARGEVVGIIGPNGAGKSTLLKVLARVTPPTEGRAALQGRLASLLEVGTGFHPELTGRENIYLNGAILGMKRAEIRARFDEIVAFAEVERFLDTPIKRYSSGMYVRLAFAVAAHLESDILLVDEVLAMGDEAFRRKCLGTMREASRGGRTVLFVSHSMASIRSLCSRTLLLRDGEIVAQGPSDEVVETYLASAGPAAASHRWPAPARGDGDGDGDGDDGAPAVRPLELALVDRAGEPCATLRPGQPLGFRLSVVVREPTRFVVHLGVCHRDGTPLFTLRREVPAGDEATAPGQAAPGTHALLVQVDQPRLRDATYFASLTLEHSQRGRIFHTDKAIEWVVGEGAAQRPAAPLAPSHPGYLEPLAEWILVSPTSPESEPDD